MKAAHGIKGSQTVALWVAGIAGAMTNTLLVMNGIYIFFGQSYAAASNKAVEHIYDVILGIILGFGIPGGDRRRYPYDGHHEGSV